MLDKIEIQILKKTWSWSFIILKINENIFPNTLKYCNMSQAFHTRGPNHDFSLADEIYQKTKTEDKK